MELFLRRAVKNCKYSHKGASNEYSQHFDGKIRKIFAWKEFIALQKMGNQKKYYIVHKNMGTHLKSLSEVLLMSTYSIYFFVEN